MTTAIPTTYAAINFRSRLEAKWAAFFDACGWPWHYEPVDLDGWIPDFALGWWPMLVEVKPFFYAHEFTHALAKITATGHREPVVLLGAVPRFEARAIGWLAVWQSTDHVEEPGEWVLHDLHMGYTAGNGRLGLCPTDGSWINVIFRTPKGGSRAEAKTWSRVCDKAVGRREPVGKVVWRYWATACNRSQWMGDRQCT